MKYLGQTLFLLVALCNSLLSADGMVVDKVYHPYVLPNEREFEWRIASHDLDVGHLLMHRLGYGVAISESVSIETYLIGERDGSGNFDLRSYEVEARWMMTEQGQYWADWGMLFELEKEKSADNWETTTALIMEKELGKSSLTLNLSAIYEWGEAIESEWESEFRAQYRYRWIPELQPAIEVYTGENYQGIGPAVVGNKRFDGQKQLKWEAGLIFEVGHNDKNHTFRLSLEYEF